MSAARRVGGSGPQGVFPARGTAGRGPNLTQPGRTSKQFQEMVHHFPSESRDQVSNAQLQGFGDSLEGFQRNLLLRALDLANVVAVQADFLGQFFLAESGSPAFDADRFTDDPVKLLRRHHRVVPESEIAETGYRLSAVIFLQIVVDVVA